MARYSPLHLITLLLLAGLLPDAQALVRIKQTLSIPMRDGQFLAADAYLPAAAGRWPVILIQTPYNRAQQAGYFDNVQDTDVLFDNVHYAFVVVDWRGFFGSRDADYPGNPTRGEDGYDTVQWISTQSWCDGRVGTWGASALGLAQLVTAQTQPPALRCCVPIVAQLGTYYEDWYPGGVWQSGVNDFRVLYFGLGLYRDYPLYTTFWRLVEQVARFDAINVPMLHITGWFDHHTTETFFEFERIRREGGAQARNAQWMLVGPWAHGGINDAAQGGFEFPVAAGEAAAEAVRFFDHYLRDQPTNWTARPAWRWFRINDDAWLTGANWPVATTTRTLHLWPDASLRDPAPPAGSAERAFVSDPANFVPAIWGPVLETAQYATQGIGDIAAIEARPDVVTFTTPPQAEPLVIEGASRARLWITASVVDCDLTVRITQVLPDGRSILMMDGVRRASLRNSFSTREPLTPGQVYAVDVPIPPLSLEIPPGGQLRLTISGSNFDRYDINPQDGRTFTTDPGAVLTSGTIRLLMSAQYPSRIELPTVRQTGAHNWQWFER